MLCTQRWKLLRHDYVAAECRDNIEKLCCLRARTEQTSRPIAAVAERHARLPDDAGKSDWQEKLMNIIGSGLDKRR